MAIVESFKPDYLEMGLHELSQFSTLPTALIARRRRNDASTNLPVQPSYLISKNPFKTSIPQLVEVQAKGDSIPY
jgi:hypothetical protein